MNTRAVNKLRKDLGMKPKQLLRNAQGGLADILDVSPDGKQVTLGVLSARRSIVVPRSMLTNKP